MSRAVTPDTDELAGFAKVVAKHGGVVAAHLRHALGVNEATEEFMEGRQALRREAAGQPLEGQLPGGV